MFFDRKKNILITGSDGQLGSYLLKYFKDKSFLKNSCIGKVFGIDINELDISDASAVSNFFNKKSIDPHIDIDYVIHCAASTDTAAIEKNPEKHYKVNCLGTKNIARNCAANGIKLIFISSDYVFSENSNAVNGRLQEFPVNQYGLQKLVAEQFAKEAYAKKPHDLLIYRSSWMFGNSDRSFVEKFLANVFKTYAEKSKDLSNKSIEVKVVDDAYGKPTAVWRIAKWIYNIAIKDGKHYGEANAHWQLPQITRHCWASIIWKSFMSLNSNKLPLDDCEMLSKLESMVKIVPISSNELGLPMHHPGKIEYTYQLDIDATPTLYETDTINYVHMNSKRLIDLAKSIINAKG